MCCLKNSDVILARINPPRDPSTSHAPCHPVYTPRRLLQCLKGGQAVWPFTTSQRLDMDELLVHQSSDYETGEVASGTISVACLRGSLAAADTPSHNFDLVLEK